MLSIRRVVPTQSAPAATTGPVMRVTGWKSTGSTISRYSSLRRPSYRNVAGSELFEVGDARDPRGYGGPHFAQRLKQRRSKLAFLRVQSLVA